MNRRFVAALILLALVAPVPQVLADRLGGCYRGPLDDMFVVRDDTASSTSTDSGAGATGGSTGGGDSGGDSGGSTSGGGDGTTDGSTAGGDSGGESDGGDTGGGDEGSEGGDEGGGEPASPDAGTSPEAGGSSGGDDGSSGGSSSGGSTPPPGGASAPTGGSIPGGSSSSGGSSPGGKKGSTDDKDKIWPFYFEGAREEYIRYVYARRPESRMSPARSSTFHLSTAPQPRRARAAIGDTDRQVARDLVLGRLKDPDAAVRDAAVIALGKSGFKDVVRYLDEASRSDADPQVREDALLALGLSGQVDIALPALLKALEAPVGGRTERRVAYAAIGLGLLGDSAGAAPKLRDMYRRTSVMSNAMDEAACTAVALGMLRDVESIDLFVKALAGSRVPDQVKVYTIHALGKFTVEDEKVRKEVVSVLSRALRDKQASVRRAAALAMGGFPESAAILIKQGMGDSDDYVKNFSAASLGRIAAGLEPNSAEYRGIAGPLVEVADNALKNRTLFQHSTVALASMAYGEHEKHLLGIMEKGLSKLDANSASAVLLSLGLMGSDSPVVATKLTEGLKDKQFGTNVQAYAGLAMALSDAPGACENLRRVFSGDTKVSADVARSVALGLGLVGGSEEVSVLVDVLKSESDRYKSMTDTQRHFLMGTATISIGLIGDASAVERLRPLMESREWRTRAFAVAALGYIMEADANHRVSPRIGDVFRHHNYSTPLTVVRQVQSIL
jgi:HEAT repeat protein